MIEINSYDIRGLESPHIWINGVNSFKISLFSFLDKMERLYRSTNNILVIEEYIKSIRNEGTFCVRGINLDKRFTMEYPENIYELRKYSRMDCIGDGSSVECEKIDIKDNPFISEENKKYLDEAITYKISFNAILNNFVKKEASEIINFGGYQYRLEHEISTKLPFPDEVKCRIEYFIKIVGRKDFVLFEDRLVNTIIAKEPITKERIDEFISEQEGMEDLFDIQKSVLKKIENLTKTRRKK